MNGEFLEGIDKDGLLIRLTPNVDGGYTEYRTHIDFFNNLYWVKTGTLWDTLNKANNTVTWHEINLK